MFMNSVSLPVVSASSFHQPTMPWSKPYFIARPPNQLRAAGMSKSMFFTGLCEK